MVVSNKSMCCNTILPRSKNVLLSPGNQAREQRVGYTKHAVRQQNCPTRVVTGRLLSLGEAYPSDQYENVSMNCPMQIDFLHLPGLDIPAPVPADTHHKNRIYDGNERLSSWFSISRQRFAFQVEASTPAQFSSNQHTTLAPTVLPQ
jgi:hypothetical protein